MHPRIPLAFLATRAHYWLMVNLSSTSMGHLLKWRKASSLKAPFQEKRLAS